MCIGNFKGIDMIQIDTANRIMIDGKTTDYTVHQTAIETAVVCYSTGQPVWCAMPHRRYSLSHDQPASGAPGKGQFESDFLALIGEQA